MRRLPWIANLLWSMVSIGSAACGRLGFDLPSDAGAADSSSDQLVVPQTMQAAVACGVSLPAPFSIAISNPGSSAIQIVDTQASGGFTLTTDLPLTIDPDGGEATLSVRAPTAVIGTDRPGDIKPGTLTLTTNLGTSHQIELDATVTGAQLAFTDPALAQLALDLTGTSGACPAPKTVLVRNTGTAGVVLSVNDAPAFWISGFSTGTVMPGSSASFQVHLYTSSACSGVGSITYDVAGDFCDTTPGVLVATFQITGATTCACS